MTKNRILLFAFTTLLILLSSSLPVFGDEYPYVENRIGKGGSENGEFYWPYELVAIDQKFYVVEYLNHRVQVFDDNWEFITKFGGEGAGDGQLDNPTSIAFNGSHLFVGEASNDRVSVYTPEGIFIDNFGMAGTAAGQFQFISDVHVDNGRVYVSDTLNERISIYNESTFEHIQDIGSPFLSFPRHIVTVNERLYVADQVLNQIIILESETGIYRGALGNPDGDLNFLNQIHGLDYVNGYFLTTSSDKTVTIIDENNNLIKKITGNFGIIPSLMNTDKSIYVPNTNYGNIIQLKIVANPTNVTVETGEKGMLLHWMIDESMGITTPDSYRIYRDAGDGMTYLGEVSDKVFVDNSVVQGMEYQYAVEAVSIIGISDKITSPLVSLTELSINTTSDGNETETEDGILSELPISTTLVIGGFILIPILRKRKN